MTGGVSIWWATPADPRHHFSSEELERSERYHRPVRTVAVAATVARGILLVAGAVLAGAVDGGGPEQWYDEAGLIDVLLSTRVVAAVAITVVALWLPGFVADWWYEYRFRRGHDHDPIPTRWFATTTVTMAAASIVIAVPVVGLGYRHAVANRGWPIVFTAVAMVGVGVWSVGERWFRAGDEVPIEADASAAVEFATLARRFGLDGLPVFIGRSRHRGPVVPERSAPNAYSTGVLGNRRVVVTEALLDQEPPIRRFVMAHELIHVVRQHVLVQTAVAVVTWAAIVFGVAALAASGRPWTWVSLSSDDPLGLPVVVLVGSVIGGALAPIGAWVSRANERAADRGAVEAIGPLSADAARRLQVSTAADLDPPLAVRLHGRHPAPAERLEILARLSR